MTTTGLDPQMISEVRDRVLRWAAESGLSHGAAADRAKVTRGQMYDFLEGRRANEEVVATIVTNLPIGLVYRPSAILPA